jgi:UDP-glucose 4-epimerase
MAILVTGGAGYIGSHTIVQLINAQHEVVVIDNLSNSSVESLRRVNTITGVMPVFYHGDIQDHALLNSIFNEHDITAVVHFAGLKSVTDSMDIPLHYYRNNINGTLTLCEEMAKNNIFNLVFSSSANVYGRPEKVPVTEDMPTGATNPYGRTKLMIEQMLKDFHASDDRWSIALLRYFNPVGAHESGLIGEDPQGVPANIMPYISQVAIGIRPELSVYGDDYDTPDGTGVRDYIHVVDLADAHLKSLDYLAEHNGLHTFNIGTGSGYSVLELVNAFTETTGIEVPYSIKERRPGDIGESWANAELANKQLGWAAKRNLQQMMQDSWRWQSQNPQGYA